MYYWPWINAWCTVLDHNIDRLDNARHVSVLKKRADQLAKTEKERVRNLQIDCKSIGLAEYEDYIVD